MAAADATDDGGILKGLFELKEGGGDNKIKNQTQKERKRGLREGGKEIVVKYWSKNGISKLLMRVK